MREEGEGSFLIIVVIGSNYLHRSRLATGITNSGSNSYYRKEVGIRSKIVTFGYLHNREPNNA